MYLPDVNVLVYAHREESIKHKEAVECINLLVNSPSKFGVSELVLSSFIRIVTNHKIFKPVSSHKLALKFCENILLLHNAERLRAGEEHYQIFSNLVRKYSLKGKIVADAYHAALAIEYGCTWLTFDSDFARFQSELRYELL